MTVSLLDPTSHRLCGAASILSDAGAGIESCGNKALLDTLLIGVFCSIECPGELILKTYDMARLLADSKDCGIIGGFQSPIEQEFLIGLLRGTTHVVVCPPRTLHAVSMAPYEVALQQGRLLLLSPFAAYERRMTRQTCERRNKFVAALADRVFVSYAAQGGLVERLCLDLIAQRKPLFAFDSDFNRNILDRGAVGISCDEHGLSRLMAGLPDTRQKL